MIRERFNAGAVYKDRILKWDTVIEQKTGKLGRFLTERSPIDFILPAPKLERQDSREVRTKILALTTSQARQLCMGKSTLHYLRRNARRPGFKVYKPVLTKLNAYGSH